MSRLTSCVVLGAVIVVAGIEACAAQALDSRAIDSGAPKHEWCVAQGDSGVPPDCAYDNLVACAIAAIAAGGSCINVQSIPIAATANDEAPSPIPLPPQRKVSTADAYNKLFQEFVRWRNKHQDTAH